MMRKWNRLKKTEGDKHLNAATRNFSLAVKITTLCVGVFAVGLGAGIYNNVFDRPESPNVLNEPVRKLASLLKKPAVMQPLPEMPTESPPGVSIQPEIIVPLDAFSIQGIDPIITGPRAQKSRGGVERAVSDRS